MNIPFYVFDCSREFEAAVLRYSWDVYARGQTPNPCVKCNEFIKWGFLLDRARALGAAKIATGHYARIRQTDDEAPMLLRAVDHDKDQAYFLFSLSDDHLRHTLFPLGELTKKEVRDYAARIGLSNAAKPDSQDACFVGMNGGFAETLRERFQGEAHTGEFVDEAGTVLGRHGGLHHYTVGQRRGLGIALGSRSYVTHIDPETARITVSINEDNLIAEALEAVNVRIHPAFRTQGTSFECEAQTRYRQRPTPVRVELRPDQTARVTFAQPMKAIAPGQAVVLFHGEQVLGGGWIAPLTGG